MTNLNQVEQRRLRAITVACEGIINDVAVSDYEILRVITSEDYASTIKTYEKNNEEKVFIGIAFLAGSIEEQTDITNKFYKQLKKELGKTIMGVPLGSVAVNFLGEDSG